jgi:signal transduction histidine kinase/ligand-binding sensor domain-containing protein
MQERDGQGVFQRGGSSNVGIQGFSEDARGRLWVTDPVGGFRPADRQADAARKARLGLEGRGFHLFHDSRGNLWVGTHGHGLWRVRDVERASAPVIEIGTEESGLLSNGVWCVIEDREGNIWVGTNRGLHRLTPHRITPLADYGLVRSVEAAAEGGVWVGTATGLIRLAGSPVAVAEHVAPLGGSDATFLALGPAGALWVATGHEVWRLAGGSLVRGPVAPGPDRIQSMVDDGRGGLWLVDGQGHLRRWTDGQLAAVALPADVSRESISLVHLDRQRRLWVAFENGRLALAPPDGSVRLLGPENGWRESARTIVNTIAEDRRGVLWIGTSGGLIRYKGGRFDTPGGQNGLSGQLVRALVTDDLGALWLGVRTSIVRLDPAEFDQALVESGYKMRMREFDAADGVAGVLFGVGNGEAAARAADGRLFFVTGRGITMLDPREVDDALHPPASPVRIESIIANDQRFTAGPDVSLPAGTARLRIDYTLPTLTSPTRTRFRYRLEGFDADWIDAGIRRQAFYTNLPAGTYRFAVQAQIPEGAWTSRTTAWDFRIAPSFYRTFWFYTVCVGVLAVAAGGTWRLRVQYLRRDLAAVYGERMRLGREIHDTLLQSLAGLALQLDGVEHSVSAADPRAPSQIARIREQMEEHIGEVRQSIWDLRSPAPQPRSLVEALGDGVRRLVTDGVRLQLDVAGTPRPCSERIEQQLLRIAREAVINAVRHGKAGSVSLKLAFDRRALRLTVTDDGCGFDPGTVGHDGDSHYGLSAMKERAAAAGGSCTVTSRPGAGTEVNVMLPLLHRWSVLRFL